MGIKNIIAKPKNPATKKASDENWEEIDVWIKLPLEWNGFFDDCTPQVKEPISAEIVGDCVKITCTVNESYLNMAGETNRLILNMSLGKPDCGVRSVKK